MIVGLSLPPLQNHCHPFANPPSNSNKGVNDYCIFCRNTGGRRDEPTILIGWTIIEVWNSIVHFLSVPLPLCFINPSFTSILLSLRQYTIQTLMRVSMIYTPVRERYKQTILTIFLHYSCLTFSTSPIYIPGILKPRTALHILAF